MDKFLQGLENQANRSTTQNGADALLTTKSGLLDLFSVSGALRGREEVVLEKMFVNAFAEDGLLATKLLFYTRDIRGGLGERRFFRVLLKYLANGHPSIIRKNIELISEYGRWDDLITLFGTQLQSEALELMKAQLLLDMKTETPSLLGKWLPSINASNKETIANGRIVQKYLDMSEKQYRQMCSKLRVRLRIIETLISQNRWDEISYSGVPSKAMTNYRKAFWKHDEDRFNEFLAKVETGEETIKSTTLYPYDIIEKIIPRGLGNTISEDRVLEAQWKALPNYVEGEHNILVVADTSYSMTGRPMATSIGLGIYFAERNSGAYKDKFITFSSKANYVNVNAEKLSDKLRQIPDIVEDTNLESVFDLVLSTAVNNKIAQDEMPLALVVITDMEMNRACTQCNSGGGFYDNDASAQYNTFHDKMEQKYAQYGYQLPNVVYWNVNSMSDVYQVNCDKKGVQLVSGQSQSTFKNVVNNMGTTPYENMIKVLSGERYSQISI